MTNKKTKSIDDEVVEMGAGKDGIYHPIAVVKVKDRSVVCDNADMPRTLPAMYEILNGFVMGLGAIENFMANMKRANRRARK